MDAIEKKFKLEEKRAMIEEKKAILEKKKVEIAAASEDVKKVT